MGGFLGIGGSQSKTDRTVQLQSFGGLNNLFNWALPQAKSATSTGISALGTGMRTLGTAGSDIGSAAGFFKNLMSGNRNAVSAAVAPQANTAQTQADASRRQAAASGTARGGGTAGPAQQQKDAQLAQIQNLMFGARTTGAEGTLAAGKAEAGVGSAQAGVGATEAGIGANLASTGETAITNMGDLATKAKVSADQQQQQMGSAIGNIAMSLLFG
jgi:hypothetical protein